MHLNEQTFELSFDLDGAVVEESDLDGDHDCTRCGAELETDVAGDT